MGFPPCPPPLCISGIRSNPAEEQLLGGPSLISCLISLMNNVPLPAAAAWPEARPRGEGGCCQGLEPGQLSESGVLSWALRGWGLNPCLTETCHPRLHGHGELRLTNPAILSTPYPLWIQWPLWVLRRQRSMGPAPQGWGLLMGDVICT